MEGGAREEACEWGFGVLSRYLMRPNRKEIEAAKRVIRSPVVEDEKT